MWKKANLPKDVKLADGAGIPELQWVGVGEIIYLNQIWVSFFNKMEALEFEPSGYLWPWFLSGLLYN